MSCFITFPGMEADWPVGPWVLLLALFEDLSDIGKTVPILLSSLPGYLYVRTTQQHGKLGQLIELN